jgi:hypothetical protein
MPFRRGFSFHSPSQLLRSLAVSVCLCLKVLTLISAEECSTVTSG